MHAVDLPKPPKLSSRALASEALTELLTRIQIVDRCPFCFLEYFSKFERALTTRTSSFLIAVVH